MSTPNNTRPVANSGGNRPETDSQKDLAKWETPTNKKGLEALGEVAKLQLLKALPRQMCDPATADRMVRCLITECQSNPALLECTPLSLFACAIRSAQLGLEIGGVLGRSYLIPFRNNKNGGKKEAQLVVGYKGFIELAHRSGMIKRITPVVVREGDQFQVVRGMHQNLIHIPKRGNTGRVTDYYVVVELTTGGIDFEEFTVEQAIAFRNEYALAKQGPWYEIQIDAKEGKHVTTNEFDGMALKTLIRRMAKRTPMSADMNQAVALDEMAAAGINQLVPPTIDDMPALVSINTSNDEPEPTTVTDKAHELDKKLTDVKNAGGGDPANFTGDFLSDAIKAYATAGGIPEELCEAQGTTIADVRKLSGKARAEMTDKFNKATEIVEAENDTKVKNKDGTLPGMTDAKQPPK